MTVRSPNPQKTTIDISMLPVPSCTHTAAARSGSSLLLPRRGTRVHDGDGGPWPKRLGQPADGQAEPTIRWGQPCRWGSQWAVKPMRIFNGQSSGRRLGVSAHLFVRPTDIHVLRRVLRRTAHDHAMMWAECGGSGGGSGGGGWAGAKRGFRGRGAFDGKASRGGGAFDGKSCLVAKHA